MLARAIATATGWIAGLLLGALTLILLAGVVGRYSGLYSLVWVEELVRAMFLWIAFLGAAVGVHLGAHFRLALIESTLPPAGAKAVRTAAQLSLALLGVALLVLGTQLVQESGFLSTNILRINFTLIYAAIPVSGVLFILFSFDHLIRQMREPAPASSGGANPLGRGDK